MKVTIELIIVFALIPFVFADSLSYSVLLNFDSGSFSLEDAVIVQATPHEKTESNEYTARIFSFSNEELYETTFTVDIDIEYSLDRYVAGQQSKPTRTIIELLLPYYPNAKTLQILKDESILLEADLSKFSTCNENKICDGSEFVDTCPSDCTCGNRVCDANENYMACSLDCASGQKDDVCDKIADGVCDPDCSNKEDFDCKRIKSGLFVYIAIAAVLIIGFFAIRKLKTPKAAVKAKK